MQHRTKLLSVFLSFVLAFSLMGVPAFADEPTLDTSDQGVAPSDAFSGSVSDLPVDEGAFREKSNEEEVSNQETQGNVADDLAPVVEEEPLVVEGGDEAAQDVETGPQEETVDKDDDAVRVAAADVIEFVYIDESTVAIGQEQNIAFGLLNEMIEVGQARLGLKRLDTGEIIELEASATADNAMLFTKTFLAEVDATGYQLEGIRYEVDDVAYYADLTDVNDESYTFDVVTQSVADAMKDSHEIAQDGDVSAFAVEDDGTLVAVESVEEAIQTADAEGVRNTDSGESVVDQEMLELGITGEEDIDETAETGEGSVDSGVDGFFSNLFGSQEAWAAASAARERYLFVAIDPGHGGSDGGASAYGLVEKNLNLSIAQYCYNELTTYTGVMPYLTRTGDEYVGLQQRVDRAVAFGADVFVSIHCNAGGGTGSEVYYPYGGSSYNHGTSVEGQQLANKILDNLTKLGLKNRGAKVRPSERVDGEGPFYNADGSIMDYYTVIQGSREAGIPGIIVEHAFVDNASDASRLSQDSFRKQLGVADATGIAQKYSLVKESTAKNQSLVQARGHSSGYGWLGNVYDQKEIGTTGKARGLEGFQANLQNAAASAGGITYRSYVGSSWQGWVSNGATSGTTGKATALQAIQIKLTGSAANKYDVYYRVHVQALGWQGWAKNGASAGSSGYGYNAEAIEIAVVPKGGAAPGSTATPYKVKTETVSYQTHVSSIGWQNAVSSGNTAGTTGRGLSIEALKVSIANQETKGGIQYNLHCSGIGWQGWKSNGATGGTTGQARQTEAIQIRLTGEIAGKYDVYYQVHSASFGWLGWAKNGETAGTEGYGYSMQALRVKLVAKGSSAPGSTSNASHKALVSYQTHVSSIGWQARSFDGAVAGTSGKALAVEALTINLPNQAYSGGISYNVHCSGIGWQGWRSTGEWAGTTGQARQTEAIQIKLTGEMANKYDVYYRVHAQGFGWLSWAKNGASAGSSGYAYRMEALQIVLVNKGGSAPGDTASPYKQKVKASSTAIMGGSQASVKQMVAYYNSNKQSYPSIYSAKGASNITQFCTILREEALAEGVRAEVLFCQAMKETGWLQFGGSVKASQCNFGGLGATSSTVGGATFANVRIGLRAQAQHLKAYASKAALNNTCVDPRFGLVTRGSAPNLENLNGKWAVPGNNYGQDISKMIVSLLKY